ncbi:MAG TPA: hypothetical protein VMP11_04830 [Verrucomicrobiae bacterium]|nr:hypothetical protein [Verrucomicrobiae bacterium]
MTIINVQSIKDAVSKGTLIDLASDYRTASTAKASLPRNTACAMSMEVYRQQVQQGSTNDRRSRLEAVCSFLGKALGLGVEPSPPDSRFRFPRAGTIPESALLKLEWYAPDEYWVVLLAEEQIRPIPKRL